MKLRCILSIFFTFSFLGIYAQSTASEQVIRFELDAPQLQSKKGIWVYLPKNYENSEKTYSVIYMHDAQNLFDNTTSYVGEWEIDEYLDSVSDDETIIVGIEHGNEKRIDELTPYEHEKYGGGKGDQYIDFIIKTLKPYIEKDYRVKAGAQNTAVFGSSLGGLISLYAIIKHPDVFGAAGIFSPALWINPEIYQLVEQSEIPSTSRFYFLTGSDEGESMVPDQERMVTLLKVKGVDEKRIFDKVIDGGKHNEAFWSDQFPDAYKWIVKQ